MIYTLQRYLEKNHKALAFAGIEIKAAQNLIITPDKAIRLPDHTTTRDIARTINPYIRAAKAKLQKELEERQVSLL